MRQLNSIEQYLIGPFAKQMSKSEKLKFRNAVEKVVKTATDLKIMEAQK